MAKEVICLLTHKLNRRIKENISRISAQKGDRDFFVLMDGELDTNSLSVPCVSVLPEDVQSLNISMLDGGLLPGSVYLIHLYFITQFPNYDAYWLIEYDVEFGGNWETFFDSYRESDSDFISSYVEKYKTNEYWPWWSLSHPEKTIEESDRVRSFNPVYRMSHRAAQFLIKELPTGWLGHSEVLLPTLFFQHNFKLLDFGWGGEFSDQTYPNHYKKNAHFPTYSNHFLKLGSHRFRPAMKKAGRREWIYHPVKMDSGLTKRQEVSLQWTLFREKLKGYFTRVSKKED